MATSDDASSAASGAAGDAASAATLAQDFLRFYLRGGAEALRAGTSLVSAPAAVVDAALQRFDQNPTPGAATTIESNPLDAFVRTPGIARRIPAVAGPAPDFLAMANPDLDRASFTRPSDASVDAEFPSDGLQGPVPIEDTPTTISAADTYVDMCAMEDAVVAVGPDGAIEVSLIWVQDYPAEVLESAAVPDPSQLPASALPRVRPVVDAAQPSVVVTECMEALQSFLGSDVFEQFTFRSHLELCPFEALDETREGLASPG